MPRVGSAYVLATSTADPNSHESASSANTTDVKTITAQVGATAMVISVKSSNARVAFGGSTPSVASALGLIFVAGAAPQFLPFARDFSFVSEAAAACELNVLWLM